MLREDDDDRFPLYLLLPSPVREGTVKKPRCDPKGSSCEGRRPRPCARLRGRSCGRARRRTCGLANQSMSRSRTTPTRNASAYSRRLDAIPTSPSATSSSGGRGCGPRQKRTFVETDGDGLSLFDEARPVINNRRSSPVFVRTFRTLRRRERSLESVIVCCHAPLEVLPHARRSGSPDAERDPRDPAGLSDVAHGVCCCAGLRMRGVGSKAAIGFVVRRTKTDD